MTKWIDLSPERYIPYSLKVNKFTAEDLRIILTYFGCVAEGRFLDDLVRFWMQEVPYQVLDPATLNTEGRPLEIVPRLLAGVKPMYPWVTLELRHAPAVGGEDEFPHIVIEPRLGFNGETFDNCVPRVKHEQSDRKSFREALEELRQEHGDEEVDRALAEAEASYKDAPDPIYVMFKWFPLHDAWAMTEELIELLGSSLEGQRLWEFEAEFRNTEQSPMEFVLGVFAEPPDEQQRKTAAELELDDRIGVVFSYRETE